MHDGPYDQLQLEGALRGGDFEVSLLREGSKVGAFSGSVSPDGTLEGSGKMQDGSSATWTGEWRAAGHAQFIPVIQGRSGTLARPFDKPSPPDLERYTPGDIRDLACAFVDSGAFLDMSGGVGRAYEELCNAYRGANPVLSRGEAAGAIVEQACYDCDPSGGVDPTCVGAVESNPPPPPTPNGVLANNLTRQMQGEVTQFETSVSISPVSSTQAVVAYNNFLTQGTTGSGIGFSRRAGTTWTENSGQLAIPVDPATQRRPTTKPSLSVDSSGAFHLAFLSINFLQNPAIRIGKSTSIDGGQTFSPGVDVLVPPTDMSADRERLAVDRRGAFPDGNEFICWTEFGVTEGLLTTRQVKVALRIDGTPDYRPPVALSPVRVAPDQAQGCQVAIAPDSTVYVVWWEEVDGENAIIGQRLIGDQKVGPLFMAASNFQTPYDDCATCGCTREALAGHIRVLPVPSLAISEGFPYVIYVAYNRLPDPGSIGPSLRSQVSLVRSTDSGYSWSQPIFVHDGSQGDKFMPAIAVNPTTNYVRALWYDRRDSQDGVSIDVYQSTSTNSGVAFGAAQRLTAAPFGVPRLCPRPATSPVADCYMGDYNSIVGLASASGWWSAWGDNSLKFQSEPDPDIRVLLGC